MSSKKLVITGQSIKNELVEYEKKPYESLFEYLWNAFDANATRVELQYKIPESGLGYVEELQIVDNGEGWDFNKSETKTFLASEKKPNIDIKTTLPRGRLGRGRYVFIWFCETLTAESKGKVLSLNTETDLKIEESVNSLKEKGTRVKLSGIRESLSTALINSFQLIEKINLEFGWFLKENPEFEIMINGEKVKPEDNIKLSEVYQKKDFADEVQKYLDEQFKVEIVLWNKKPQEYAKFYFIDAESGFEKYTEYTSLNKKKDDYWHSVYVWSNLFRVEDIRTEEETNQEILGFDDNKEVRNIKRRIIDEIKLKLVHLRKPLLEKKSEQVLAEIKKQKLIPDLEKYGIYDHHSYDDLIKKIYVISPSLLTGRSNQEVSFICATFAGLLSVPDSTLIKTLLEQIQELTEDEKSDLEDILQRTSLSNVVKTIKEIDYRLDVINDLEGILFINEEKSLEVKNLQVVLNANAWIFGEQYRLFSNTEGALKKTLYKYARDILQINEPEISSTSRKELDLFLVKSIEETEFLRKNVVIEIKRPKIILGKIEYDQIEEYALEIKKESICNGDNYYWDYYLIGNDYDEYIANKIESAKNLGETQKGLTLSINDSRIKIYVRKWSDILSIEHAHKMKYLKDSLQIKARLNSEGDPDQISDKYLAD